jgi:DNA mismatch repair ATPase MutS
MISLLCLMNQLGCYVPCNAGCTFPIFSHVLTRIGAEDKQSEGISTFMNEMRGASEIIKKANKKTLVVIDELGRGKKAYLSIYLSMD